MGQSLDLRGLFEGYHSQEMIAFERSVRKNSTAATARQFRHPREPKKPFYLIRSDLDGPLSAWPFGPASTLVVSGIHLACPEPLPGGVCLGPEVRDPQGELSLRGTYESSERETRSQVEGGGYSFTARTLGRRTNIEWWLSHRSSTSARASRHPIPRLQPGGR